MRGALGTGALGTGALGAPAGALGVAAPAVQAIPVVVELADNRVDVELERNRAGDELGS